MIKIVLMVLACFFCMSSCSVKAETYAQNPLPVEYMSNKSLGFCDINKRRQEPNIHTGIDFSAPSGTPVYGVCSGVVELDHANDAILRNKYSRRSECNNRS